MGLLKEFCKDIDAKDPRRKEAVIMGQSIAKMISGPLQIVGNDWQGELFRLDKAIEIHLGIARFCSS